MKSPLAISLPGSSLSEPGIVPSPTLLSRRDSIPLQALDRILHSLFPPDISFANRHCRQFCVAASVRRHYKDKPTPNSRRGSWRSRRSFRTYRPRIPGWRADRIRSDRWRPTRSTCRLSSAVCSNRRELRLPDLQTTRMVWCMCTSAPGRRRGASRTGPRRRTAPVSRWRRSVMTSLAG